MDTKTQVQVLATTSGKTIHQILMYIGMEAKLCIQTQTYHQEIFQAHLTIQIQTILNHICFVITVRRQAAQKISVTSYMDSLWILCSQEGEIQH